MHKSILVTGIAGTGKSAVCAELKRRGFRAYDLERIQSLFHMVHKKTGKTVDFWNNRDLGLLKQLEWVCDKEKLEKLARSDKRGVVFFCGAASNIEELYSLFNQVLLLKASPKVLGARLRTRTTNDFAKDPKVRRWYLASKNRWEHGVIEAGSTVVNANQPLELMANDIIREARR